MSDIVVAFPGELVQPPADPRTRTGNAPPPLDWADVESHVGPTRQSPNGHLEPVQEAPPPLWPARPDDWPQADANAFWAARRTLAHIHAFARSRMCSPFSVAAVVLARVITCVPPFVVLPSVVGSEASLNLFIALTGPSGSGKGASESCAADAVITPPITRATVGSGEGIAHLYAHRDKGDVVRDRDAVLFTVPEVDNLVALGNRQGATLLPQLRSAWSGETLGFSYADKTKALPVNAHTYRLSLVLGVQPGRAAPLLDDTDGGTPQRFLWVPTTDPDAPDHTPAAPPAIDWTWTRHRWPTDRFGRHALAIPTVAENAIREVRRNQLRGEGDPLDGHAMLARLKLSAALGMLEERDHVDEEDWQLAGVLMAVSDATRTSVRHYLTSRFRRDNTARARAEGERATIVAETVTEAATKRVAKGIRRHLVKAGGSLPRAELRRKFSGPDRAYFDTALMRLTDLGQVLEEPTEHGSHLVLQEDQ